MKRWLMSPYRDFVDLLYWAFLAAILIRPLMWYYKQDIPEYPMMIIEILIQVFVIVVLHFIVRAAVLAYLWVSGLLIKS